MIRYEVTLTNWTAGQPMSPMVVMLHRDGFRLFEIGERASEALERLAEGAETEAMIRLTQVSNGVVSADDGLASSALRDIHRWDHPAARLTVRRLN